MRRFEGEFLAANDLASGDCINIRDILENVISSGPVEHGFHNTQVEIQPVDRGILALEFPPVILQIQG